MIERMKKYSFVLYHLDYKDFLAKLQNLGMMHIIRSTNEQSEILTRSRELIAEYAEGIKFLQKYSENAEQGHTNLPTKALLNQVNKARGEKETLSRAKDGYLKQIKDLQPWGHFDYDLVQKLKAAGIFIDFHHCLKNHFKAEWEDEYPIIKVAERSGSLYFAVLYTGEQPALEADTFSFHQHTLQEFETKLKEVEEKLEDIESYFANTAKTAIDLFQQEIARLTTEYDYEDATLQGTPEAENHVVVLSGWIPISREEALLSFVKTENVIHFVSDARVEENPPIRLRNNWFSRLFEPITRMYMLPKYDEFDLTPFFAPFFMLFFGFCNADMAYGVILVLLTLFLRSRMKDPTVKGFLSLIMLFGVSSIIMGWVMGTILGFDMKEFPVIGQQILIRNTDQIFNFGLLLGVIQILFGIGIATAKKMRQAGFVNGLSSIGSFLFISTLSVLGAQQLGTDISAVQAYLKYPMWAGLALILLFNQPGKNPIINILGGLWVLYNMVTGFFGDILSYIRLFALGVSSAILGFVINSIGSQMLGIPIAGPVVFVLFMIFGHALNLALGGLSGFVHPLRLTFVEFFKNAEFTGPGMEYKPFSKS
jgi:V/A-type H+/Na+-transporting ATPase subunit I